MKQFLIVLSAVLIVLFAYDRLVVSPREAAQAHEAQLRDQQAAQRAEAQARQISQAQDASVDPSVAQAQAVEKLDKQRGRIALAVDALARASAVKAQLAEYYMTEGRWPRNRAEAGVAPAEQFAGGGVAGIYVDENGRIDIHLNDRITSSAYFRLWPKVSQATGIIEWKCELVGARDIASHMRECQR